VSFLYTTSHQAQPALRPSFLVRQLLLRLQSLSALVEYSTAAAFGLAAAENLSILVVELDNEPLLLPKTGTTSLMTTRLPRLLACKTQRFAGEQNPPTGEIMKLKVLVCRHPGLYRMRGLALAVVAAAASTDASPGAIWNFIRGEPHGPRERAKSTAKPEPLLKAAS
jgi:hypothetical protein